MTMNVASRYCISLFETRDFNLNPKKIGFYPIIGEKEHPTFMWFVDIVAWFLPCSRLRDLKNYIFKAFSLHPLSL